MLPRFLYTSIIIFCFAQFVITKAEICTREGDARIVVDVDGTNEDIEDVIQVCFHNGNSLEWIYICASGWDNDNYINTDVFCKRLGYLGSNNEAITKSPRFGDGIAKLSMIDCFGNETSITQCSFSIRTGVCKLVSDLKCEECGNMLDCHTATTCEERPMSEFKSCICENECMNGGYCFDERCVCQSEYTGSSCETYIMATTTTSDSSETFFTTTAPTSNETSLPISNEILVQISNQTSGPTSKQTSQIITSLPTLASTGIKVKTTIPKSSQNTTLSTKTSDSSENQTNDPTFPIKANITKNIITEEPTKSKSPQNQDCSSKKKCNRKDDERNRRIIRLVYLVFSIVVILMISIVVFILSICSCFLFRKLKKYKKCKQKVGATTANLISSESNDLEITPYYSNVTQVDDTEIHYESVCGDEATISTHHSLETQSERQNTQRTNHNENNSTITNPLQTIFQGNETQFNDDYVIRNMNCVLTYGENLGNNQLQGENEPKHFYHRLVDKRTNPSILIFPDENDIINQLIRDRKMEELDYIDPPYNLQELSNCIGHLSNEIAVGKLKFGDFFAAGNFGVVYKAVYTTKYGELPVAIKALKTEANKDLKVAFIREAAILAQFNHPNILRFVGVVTTMQPNMIVTELLDVELREYLIKMHNTQENSYQSKCKLHKVLLKFCQEIAAGMEHLALKRYIHRDLAARNILLAKDMSCRIADFGMSRNLKSDDYYTSKGGRIPLRWSAPESVLYNKYSEKSDVWAYGMTLFEIWTLGSKPWENNTNEEIVEFITKGEIPLQPIGCCDDVYKVMKLTWKQSSRDRPSFSEIKQMISEELISPFTMSIAI